jgi:hypothetical protein
LATAAASSGFLDRAVLPEPQHEDGALVQRQQAAGTQQQLPVEHGLGAVRHR